ncbi:MAG: glycogen debranching protein GlgX [Blautia sp.]|nr:glycogen debranching protein GlgX [Blautia sp.]
MRRIDELDFIQIDGVNCCKGHVFPFGASLTGNGGINFSVNSTDAEGCELVLYHSGDRDAFAHIKIPDEFRIGNNYSIIVFGQDMDSLEYTYRFSGKYLPEEGYWFDPQKDLLDPYAKLISGREVWEQSENAPMRCRVILDDFPWEGDRPLEIPFEDLVIYETHVRGFTQDPACRIKYKGTFRGITEMIPYFKDLGVNCVELLPVFEFDETQNFLRTKETPYVNFWGYSTVCFFAPKSAYAVSGPMALAVDEMKNMVKQLHKNGIEVILDVVFNHTAEMGRGGPTFNYRGIDNRTYYHLDEKGNYVDYSGCGNTVNCNNAIVRQHILDCLRYWVSDYHVDGFRFDEAPILSRDTEGKPMQSPPLLETLAHDPVLAKTKLIAEAWDAAGLYQVGSFPAPDKWAEWNGKFRDCVRRFVKSDASAGPELIYRIQGSPDFYQDRKFHPTVNFITCHDGFTLNDLVSYNEKHNIENGENNRDGSDYNASWNCGVEGETSDPEIEFLRNRQVKNMFALLLMSRGTPMMLSGDEFRNSQKGNNNVYCQDSPLSWVNWSNKEKYPDVYEFCQGMIRLRHDHPVLRRHDYYTAPNSSGYPELSFHGVQPWNLNAWEHFHTFGFMYAEPAADFHTKEDCFIYCAVNAFWESRVMHLPELPQGMKWELYLYTADRFHGHHEQVGTQFGLMSRSLAVFLGR